MDLSINKIIFALAFFVLLAPYAVQAQTDAQIDIIPADQANNVDYDESGNTHPPLKLTPDKSTLVDLDQDAGSIIIGNPAHLNIMTDTTRRLVVIPRQPGASHFIVLGREGQVVMQRHVIVASPQKDYIRIRRNCASSEDEGCTPTSVYYCPDMCHEIAVPREATQAPAQADGMNQSAGSGGALLEDEMPPNATAE